MTINQQHSLPWPKIKAKSAAAAKANLDKAIRDAKGVELPSRSTDWDSSRNTLELFVGSQRGVFWKEQKFFLVDSELAAGKHDNRYVANYAAYYSKTGMLRLEIPIETQDGLRRASKVRAFRVDKDQVRFAQLWVDAHRQIDRGPLVPDLWSQRPSSLIPWSPSYLPKNRTLNPGQQRALAAMTSEGGYFVWGPPGTGKTTVITSAVHRALAQNQSVLITSHTNVAVDNVLKGLVEDDHKYSLGIMKPGAVIRHSGSPNKVLDVVRDHDYLLVDKAAAVLTKHESRLNQLLQLQQLNIDHPDRTLEKGVFDQLEMKEIDVGEVRRARRLGPVQDRISIVEAHASGLAPQLRDLADAVRDLRTGVESYDGVDEQLNSAQLFEDQIVQANSEWTEEKNQRMDQRSHLILEMEVAVRRQQAAELRSAMSWVRFFPWIAKGRRLAAIEAQAVVSELHLAMRENEREGAKADDMLAAIAGDRRSNLSRMAILRGKKSERDKLWLLLSDASSDYQSISENINLLHDEIEHLKGLILDEQINEKRLIEIRASEGWKLVAQYDDLLAAVAKLDEDHERLATQRKQLEDEYKTTKTKLFTDAPVVATTMTALASQEELQKRRFDIVIIDEAASAESPSIVYAASKADTTLAIVGDFLQNAPISDAEDAVVESEKEIVKWQRSDIFALAGIVDRASAESHERCVAISLQYRYPPLIADLVNKFCYDGLLESSKKEDSHGAPVITFIDTSGLPDGRLSKAGTSWKCEATLEIAVRLSDESSDDPIGYVTPYSPQADAMGSKVKALGLNVEAGTSHRFQGREFAIVIIDLMQDERPRWVAAADLNGPARAVSAAKLLNVALTRVKKRLYLIGNWPFVRGHDSPGMRALADLEVHPYFEVQRL